MSLLVPARNKAPQSAFPERRVGLISKDRLPRCWLPQRAIQNCFGDDADAYFDQLAVSFADLSYVKRIRQITPRGNHVNIGYHPDVTNIPFADAVFGVEINDTAISIIRADLDGVPNPVQTMWFGEKHVIGATTADCLITEDLVALRSALALAHSLLEMRAKLLVQ